MHLSILSDCFLSDTLCESGFRGNVASKPRVYCDSLLRGLVLIATAAILAGLTFLSQLSQPAAADPAPHAARSTGSAVNALHREVTRL